MTQDKIFPQMVIFLDICNGHVDTKIKYTILFLADQNICLGINLPKIHRLYMLKI